MPSLNHDGQFGKFAAMNGWTISCTNVPPPVAMFMISARLAGE